jgi:predicted MFS family arabinose efflux permease
VDHAIVSPSAQGNGLADVRSGRRQLLGDRRYWLALPALLASPFMMTGIFIHQNFIVTSKGWTLDWLATCFVVYGITHWLASLNSGLLVDRFKALRLLPFIGVPLLLALLLLAFVPGWWVALAMMVLLGIGAGAAPPITGALWAEVYGTASLGQIRSVNVTMSVLSTAIAPVLFGYVIDAGGSPALLFGSCALYVAIAAALLYFSYPRNQRNHPL